MASFNTVGRVGLTRVVNSSGNTSNSFGAHFLTFLRAFRAVSAKATSSLLGRSIVEPMKVHSRESNRRVTRSRSPERFSIGSKTSESPSRGLIRICSTCFNSEEDRHRRLLPRNRVGDFGRFHRLPGQVHRELRVRPRTESLRAAPACLPPSVWDADHLLGVPGGAILPRSHAIRAPADPTVERTWPPSSAATRRRRRCTPLGRQLS